MLDRDGRVVFGSLLAFVVILGGSTLIEGQFGVSLFDQPLLAFVVFAGVAIAAPQLYLAVVDDDPWARERVQFATVTTAVLAIAFGADAEGGYYLIISTIGACSLLGLVAYEVYRWHRLTVDERPQQTQ
ncbi:hypothetical protein [Natronorubrum daqingense]|uniref:Uncharacterized protein n=1 Tax=Natronorubrum daqingense TaxID=588898 RepID=A0A1N7D166_9EURY|nr:hypothetical protein [Natronorubrum daqingense]APX97151.1 hypothetical protein BB347_11260 [Natronorubrum daqingense]SIR69507.1 hypothetical protein SAMN05421809_1986 [Natronorubrum daqingense]